MHTAKDHLVTLPCAYTRQSTHVTHTCASGGEMGVPGRPFAVRACARRTAKPPARRTATTIARQRLGARQRIGARQRNKAHGKAVPHGNGPGARQRRYARQRSKAHGKACNARQRPLPCMYGSAHGKEFVAVCDIAVCTLPSVDARQRLCRVFCSLCRAPPTHGKDTVSGSVCQLVDS
jgi:hypothetical protein